jgi:hypothetical protein
MATAFSRRYVSSHDHSQTKRDFVHVRIVRYSVEGIEYAVVGGGGPLPK